MDLNPSILIFCVQETKFTDKTVKNIPGFNSEFKQHINPHGHACGGLAVYFRDFINYERIRVDDPKDNLGNSKIEYQLFRVHLGGSPFMLVNLYSRGCDLESLEHISASIKAKDELRDCIINGDFNAHNPIWGSPSGDRQGRDVWEWAGENNLILLNDGSITRVDKSRGGGELI